MVQPNQAPPTIPNLKLTFLQHQLLLLSQPLRPTSSLISALATSSSSPPSLRQKTIDEVLLKLNSQVKKHNKLIYSPQAQRHVAEQIWRLYWGAAEGMMTRGGGTEEWVGQEWREMGGDMCKAELITSLPESWDDFDSDGNSEIDEVEQEKRATFTNLQQRLKDLNEQRRLAKEKVERCRALTELLEPFEDVKENVQANLVTKGGEVERELEKMKMLLLRVKRGVAGLGERRVDVDGMEGLEEEGEGGVDERLARLLGGS